VAHPQLLSRGRDAASAGSSRRPMIGIPTPEQTRAWVGLTTAQVSDEDLTQILDAEQRIQTRICELPDDADGTAVYPDPLARALLRRVQCHLAKKNLPLGMVGGDAMEWSPVSLQSWDAEVQRLESSYLIPVVS
jgi:hypothetical protein